MAKSPAAPKPRKKHAQAISGGAMTSTELSRSENPMDWLYDNPLGPYPNFVFGILKQSYQSFRNSAVEFGGRKLRPVQGQAKDRSLDPEDITAYRSGTVLPEDAPDVFDDISVLLQAIDKAACPHEPVLLIYVTLGFPEARRLHHCWEEARAFSHAAFSQQRKLPVGLCQHRPGEVGSDNPTHMHLLICPRRLDGTGFRGYATDLICDDGQRVIFEEWMAFRSAWAASKAARRGDQESRTWEVT